NTSGRTRQRLTQHPPQGGFQRVSMEALKQFCELLGLPATGTKALLRARVAFALAHPGEPLPKALLGRKKSGKAWPDGDLSPDTVITENASFGPRFRNYFKGVIGAHFVCHGDFMDWVRANSGATLADAAEAWLMLEARKDDPAFRREIAACNNYLQYLRDARDAVPDLTLDEAKACWDIKKLRPAQDGIVVFETADVALITRDG
ncbi:MAG: DUF6434 domain-containing protein, partial [Pseudomonadota bacterium]